jgi:hypothetical protein
MLHYWLVHIRMLCLLKFLAPKDVCSLKDELEMIWKEEVVVCVRYGVIPRQIHKEI